MPPRQPPASKPPAPPKPPTTPKTHPPSRNRRWEKANRAFSYRIDPELHHRLHSIKAELNDPNFTTTVDLIAQSIMEAGLEAYDRGDAEIDGHRLTTARKPNPNPRPP